MTCGFAVVIGLLGVGACGEATEAGAGLPASAECASWPDCDPASESASAPTSGTGDEPVPAPSPSAPEGPPPASPTDAPPSAEPTGPPAPAPPDVDNVSCLQVVLNANVANQQFVSLPVDADLAARAVVADQFDTAAAGIDTQASAITDPAIQAKAGDVAAELRALAGVLRTGSPIENSTLIMKLSDLQTYCGLA